MSRLISPDNNKIQSRIVKLIHDYDTHRSNQLTYFDIISEIINIHLYLLKTQ